MAQEPSQSHSQPQLALLKRGKRQLATFFRNEFGRSLGHQQLDEILKYLLDEQKPVDFECVDWCRSLISGGVPFSEFAEHVRTYDVAKVCGLVWTANFVAYRCRTCGISPCMSLCPDCFYGADHTGHDFNMFRSHAGGACDCGDVSVMKEEGFCAKHGSCTEATAKNIPAELTNIAKLVIPKLIIRFLYYFRSKCPEWTSSRSVGIFEDGNHLIGLLHELMSMGDVMRSIISDALVDTDLYSKEILHDNLEEEAAATDYKTTCYKMYKSACHAMVPPSPMFYRVKVCKHTELDSEVATHRRCSYECMQSAVKDLALSDELKHTACLEEIVFWTVKFEFPEKVTTWLLGLLPETKFKEMFTKTFVDHYTRISTTLMQCKGNEERQRVSNKVVHVSVQLFSNEVFAVRMASDRQLLTRMVISLYNMLSTNLMQSSMQSPRLNTHQVLDCAKDIIKDHCFWPLISDLVNIMSHKPVAMMFMEDSTLLEVWFEMIGFLQGMNLNERELVQHVEYETDTYYASFSAEFEISCSPLWRLLLHCKDSRTNDHLVNVLKKLVAALSMWFDCVGLTSMNQTVKDYQVSFHLPLHRYLSAFLCSAVQRGAFFDLSTDFLKLLLIHPLQIQVAFYEIFAQMWVRNGLQIRGQAMTYTQCHFCNSLVDLDLFLLQVCASQLEPDYLLQTIIRAFHLKHWLSPQDAPYHLKNIEPAQDGAMLEGCLTLLAMMLSVRTYSGQTTENILKKEIVTLLCMNDRTYSQLCEAIPEKSGMNGPPHDLKDDLTKVADFKAPGFNVMGKLQQGTYSPKPDVWRNEYDPLYTMLRTVHRREFQQSMDRYTEFVRLTDAYPQGKTPWPPLRLPSDPHPAYIGLYNLVRCRSTLALCFNLFLKKLNSKHNSMTDTKLYLSIYIMQIMVHVNDVTTNMELDEEGCYIDWFPCTTVLDNLLHTVTSVVVEPFSNKTDENKLLDIVDMDADETGQLQTMFQRSGSTTIHPGGSMAVVRRLQERSAPLPVDASLIASGSSFRHESAIEVTVNESMVSLLIKLHNKLSDQEGSYVPLSLRRGAADNKTLLGDGPFFVGRLLDTLFSKSERCAEVILKTYKNLLPKSDEKDTSASTRKKKAADRQKRLMEKMAKMQSKFMDKIEKTMSKDEFEKLTETDSNADEFMVIEHYECSICASTSPSTNERPMGMIALMQCTSVLNYARLSPEPDKLPLSPDSDGSNTKLTFATFYQNKKKLLEQLHVNNETAYLSSIGIDRQEGIFLQSCGHFLHLDCCRAYQESVNAHARSQQNLSKDEYYCPMCRQLANMIVPILPTGSNVPVQIVPAAQSELRAKEIGVQLLKQNDKNNTDSFTQAVHNVLHLITNQKRELLSLASNSTTELSHFISSVARGNIDYALLYEWNDIVVPSRKACIQPLLTTLALLAEKLNTAQVGADCLDTWAQLSGVIMENKSQSMSLAVRQNVVPLLLRDPITVFVQLYLALPPYAPIGYVDMVAAAVYNLTYVQALMHVSCKFNDEERQSWLHRPSSASRSASLTPGSVGMNILQLLIKQLSTVRFYPADDATTSFLECSIWSPQSVENFVQHQCLPYVQFVAMLKHHMYNTDLLISKEPEQQFTQLCRNIGLIADEEMIESPSQEALNWVVDDPSSVINGWFSFIMTCKERPTVRSLIMGTTKWFAPKLLELPPLYDTIFQHYRNRTCRECHTVPQAPSVCLICGTFVCFKEVCCPQQSGVLHAKNCGAGTSVILDINASIVAIIRGKRATLWGSVYLDEHGEEDRDLKRGKPLYLCKERYRMLEEQWLSHNFDYVCKRWIFHADQL